MLLQPSSPQLQPGDCLLYAPRGFFGWVIATKTWHKVAHVEVYDRLGFSYASRDGVGVGRYPVRMEDLAYVLRPQVSLNLDLGRAYAERVKGTKYGWLELANFVGLPVRNFGIFCSQFETAFYRACGWHIFPEVEPDQVAPFEFLDLVGQGFSLVYDNVGNPHVIPQ